MPLYKLQIEGVVLKSITQVFKTIPTYKTLAEQYAAQFEKACNTYLGALNILDTMEEVSANTKANQLAGALALKEAYSTLNSNIELKGYSKFSDIPTANGIHVYYVAFSEGNYDTESPYPTKNVVWWNVLQFGRNNRLTQITSQAYSSRPGNNELWIRNRHDSSWSSWVKI